jgi:hypothetical protein
MGFVAHLTRARFIRRATDNIALVVQPSRATISTERTDHKLAVVRPIANVGSTPGIGGEFRDCGTFQFPDEAAAQSVGLGGCLE